jgi:hypothetical protein
MGPRARFQKLIDELLGFVWFRLSGGPIAGQIGRPYDHPAPLSQSCRAIPLDTSSRPSRSLQRWRFAHTLTYGPPTPRPAARAVKGGVIANPITKN